MKDLKTIIEVLETAHNKFTESANKVALFDVLPNNAVEELCEAVAGAIVELKAIATE